MKKYREITAFGESIDYVIALFEECKEKGELVSCSFNGKMLYSDIDNIDSAYLKITGYNKEEFKKIENERYEKSQREKERHLESIPRLTHEFIEKGKKILDEKYHELWQQCVPIRLRDLYRGMELSGCLDIVKELNNGCDLSEAKNIIKKQGHSGMSFSLMCAMVDAFCDRGKEFVEYVRIN